MDIDFDLESDRISDFLKTKLEEIKLSTQQLEKQIRNRNEVVLNLHRNKEENLIVCGLPWKRRINRKYVIGVDCENKSTWDLTNLKVLLSWNHSSTLSYNSFLLSEDYQSLNSTLKTGESAELIVVFANPQFTDQLEYKLTISIICKANDKRNVEARTLPIIINAQDEDQVHFNNVLEGKIEDFLSSLVSQNKYELIAELHDEVYSNAEKSLLDNCNFTKVKLKSKRIFFVAHRISLDIDGCLLEMAYNGKNIFEVIMYCRDEYMLTSVLHYLHNHLHNVTFISKSVYKPNPTSDGLRKCLSKEINYLKGKSFNRLKLADLQHKTDIIVTMINKE